MSLDFNPECAAIFARISNLCGGRVLEGIDDTEEMDAWWSGQKPYITVLFGQPRVVLRDRGLLLDDQQPHAMNATIRVWAATAEIARAVLSEVMRRLVGFVPTDNASQVTVFGGGDFRPKDSGARPTKRAQQIQVEWLFNMETAQS